MSRILKEMSWQNELYVPILKKFRFARQVAIVVAQRIVRLWTPEGQIDCPQKVLSQILAATYSEQGYSEIASCCHTTGCLIVPNPQRNQDKFKMGYFDSRAFKGHRFFSSFDQIADRIYQLFRQSLTVEILEPCNSLFQRLTRDINWLTQQNEGYLSEEPNV